MTFAVARLFRSALALVAMTAILVAGPLGSGLAAAAADLGEQESRLEREIDRLSSGERLQLERQLSERLAEMGIQLDDPAIQTQLADVLGVPVAEMKRAVEGSDVAVRGSAVSTPIALLFVAVALIFVPSLFQSIANTIYGDSGVIGGSDGVDSFDPPKK